MTHSPHRLPGANTCLASPSSPTPTSSPSRQALAGEYSLDRELGRGGMGIVYLAREVRLARQVAIKVLPPALAARADLREAFLRESQTVARLNHPNIVPVHAAGERDGYVYIVMAFVEGITLGERIRTRGPLLPGQAARMLREVAWALAYAHGAGIVHRDVSAENILLERGTDRAIVMDFGIASAMQSTAISDDGRVMGNAHYVSPEQAVGEPLDARSDLYSLGVCGFYALTGRLPFDAETPEEIVTQHLTTPAPPVSRFAHTVPSRLAQAVDKCLAKDPDDRYRSAEAFAEAIDLAFEHAKEIPIALRVWIQQGEKETGPRAMLMLWGAALGSLVSVVHHNPWLFPALRHFGWRREQRVDRDATAARAQGRLRGGRPAGRAAGARARSERRAAVRATIHLRGAQSRTVRDARRFGELDGIALVDGQEFGRDSGRLEARASFNPRSFSRRSSPSSPPWDSPASSCGTGCRRRWRISRSASGRSKWGARLAKLAGVGLETADRPALGMRMLTEVALGASATDHLFQALPKAVRRELADLPDTVRRLEQDATKLRASIDSLDDHLAVYERSAMRESARTQCRAVRARQASRASFATPVSTHPSASRPPSPRSRASASTCCACRWAAAESNR